MRWKEMVKPPPISATYREAIRAIERILCDLRTIEEHTTEPEFLHKIHLTRDACAETVLVLDERLKSELPCHQSRRLGRRRRRVR